MFTTLVAADVYGTKANFEVTFPTVPQMSELTRQVESIYAVECASKRPVGVMARPFVVGRFQLYDERLQQWVDLRDTAQLTDRAQLYVLPPEEPPAVQQPVRGSPVRYAAPPAAAPAAASSASPYRAPGAPAAGLVPAMDMRAAAHAAAAAAAATPVVHAPVVARPVLPDNATHDDKVRVTFEEIDVNRNRGLEPEELRRAFEMLRMGFSGATVAELVAKADADRNGIVSFEEWQRFGEQYPTVIDSFYFRFKAHWENIHRQQDIAAAKEFLCELKEREQQAKVCWLEAQRDSDAARARLSAQEQSLAQAADAQRAAEQALLESRRDVERAAADRHAREHELGAQREREAHAAQLVADATRDTEAAAARLAQAQAETAAAQERERQAHGVLQAVQAEVERQRQLTAQRGAEVADARSREQAAALAAAEAVRDSTLAGERLSRADVDVAAKQQREVELDAHHTQSQHETAHCAARRDEEVRALQVQREQEEGAHALRLDAQRLAEDADRRVVAQEAENTAFNQKRRQVEEQEAPLLEQEIRLRAQRSSLEEKEAKLRGDHRAFQEAALQGPAPQAVAPAVASPPRAYAPPSPAFNYHPIAAGQYAPQAAHHGLPRVPPPPGAPVAAPPVYAPPGAPGAPGSPARPWRRI